MSFENIATVTVSSPISTITFSSIPQNFADIILIVSPLKTTTTNSDNLTIRFNSDASTTYLAAYRFAQSGSAGYTQNFNATTGIPLYRANSNNTGFHTDSTLMELTINGYSSTNRNKIYYESGGFLEYNYTVSHTVGLWPSTAAINRIDLVYSGDDTNTNQSAGATFSLYGVKA